MHMASDAPVSLRAVTACRKCRFHPPPVMHWLTYGPNMAQSNLQIVVMGAEMI